ncbi:CDP-alcohol phosphatidyltransferase family protein [Longispora sp. NPDC051575]|uniref:CDP-alcohol phosphatidyltransferase family protein n=1 Tax=Longispora sp. NPDC051575 TaxID=3154943 RepID=UPI00343C8E62
MRRSGTLARSVLVRTALVGRRRRDGGDLLTTTGAADVVPDDLASLDRRDLVVSRNPAAQSPAIDEPLAGPISIPLLPGERTLDRRIKFGLVNACTISSIMGGMFAVFLSMQGQVLWAAACILACVTFDGLDGALARKFGVASPFGAQMDSMADMSSFGLAVPVVLFSWLQPVAPVWLLAPACALIAVCSAIRLARFNVSPKDGRFFCGVPTTMAATILALSVLLIKPSLGLAVAVAAIALLMVTTFPYAKLARVLRLPRWLLVVPVLGGLADYQITFMVLIGAYLVSGPVLWLRHREAAL